MDSSDEVEIVEAGLESEVGNDGPWGMLWCGLAGLAGLVLHWLFGSHTFGGYAASFVLFAGIMYAILWVSRRAETAETNQS